MQINTAQVFLSALAFSALFFSCVGGLNQEDCQITSQDCSYGHASKYGFSAYQNLEQAQRYSKQNQKPILLLFTCWGCMFSPEAPWEMINEEEIRDMINERFIFSALYVDDKRPLSTAEKSLKITNDEMVKTVGQKNSAIQKMVTKSNTQPQFIIVDSDLKPLTEPIGYLVRGEESLFRAFLLKGLEKVNSLQK